MSHKRIYQTFTHREAFLRICCDRFEVVTNEIIRQRQLLEDYITRHPEFKTSLEPIDLLPDAPIIAQQMARAARLAGTGPMAAVAGAVAQCAAQAGIAAGAEEAVVDNGGDIYLKTTQPIIIALYPGASDLSGKLAFSIRPEDTPLAVCSSSGKMGHSMSLGQCDLATVVAKDAALADAAATQAANYVTTPEDIEPALNKIAAIEGIDGVLIIKDGQTGLIGKLPPLAKTK